MKPSLLLLLVLLMEVSRAVGQVPRFEPSTQPPIALPKAQKIDFGYLVVLENRSRPQGPTIRLPVAILRSRSKTPQPDPVVYTAGGPGGSSLEVAKYGEYYRYLDDRDLIVFEQRGTRYAQPCLDCPEVTQAGDAMGSLSVTDPARVAVQQQAAARCRTRLARAGIDLAAYTTEASATDLEELRQVLGIKQWNLYGVSYSTKLMLEVMRRYPDGVRSAVLDSPLPPQVSYEEEQVSNWGRSAALLFRDCAADPACARAFPNLQARFYRALRQATATPLLLTVRNPRDSSEHQVQLRGADIAQLVNLGSTGDLPGLPMLLDQISRADYRGLQRVAQARYSVGDYAWGLRYCVWCQEEAPFARPARVARQSRVSPALAGWPTAVVPGPVCQAWQLAPAPDRVNAPVVSAVPTLIICGEYDSDTPVSWGHLAAKTLKNGHVVEMKGLSHNPTQFWDNSCGMDLAQAFFTTPRQAPAIPCLTQLKAPRFTTQAKP